MHTLIDSAYGVYNNMRSQIGGAISFGWGLIHEKTIMHKTQHKKF